jgi:hypothetical protein
LLWVKKAKAAAQPDKLNMNEHGRDHFVFQFDLLLVSLSPGAGARKSNYKLSKSKIRSE